VKHCSDLQQICVFGEPPHNWLEECIHPKANSKDISVMVWGSFLGKHKGPLVFLDHSIMKIPYLKLLKRHLPPVLRHIWEPLRNPIFQQHYTQVHKAHAVLDRFQHNNITLDNYSPSSPDLNHLEQVLLELQCGLSLHYPFHIDTKGGHKAV